MSGFVEALMQGLGMGANFGQMRNQRWDQEQERIRLADEQKKQDIANSRLMEMLISGIQGEQLGTTGVDPKTAMGLSYMPGKEPAGFGGEAQYSYPEGTPTPGLETAMGGGDLDSFLQYLSISQAMGLSMFEEEPVKDTFDQAQFDLIAALTRGPGGASGYDRQGVMGQLESMGLDPADYGTELEFGFGQRPDILSETAFPEDVAGNEQAGYDKGLQLAMNRANSGTVTQDMANQDYQTIMNVEDPDYRRGMFAGYDAGLGRFIAPTTGRSGGGGGGGGGGNAQDTESMVASLTPDVIAAVQSIMTPAQVEFYGTSTNGRLQAAYDHYYGGGLRSAAGEPVTPSPRFESILDLPESMRDPFLESLGRGYYPGTEDDILTNRDESLPYYTYPEDITSTQFLSGALDIANEDPFIENWLTDEEVDEKRTEIWQLVDSGTGYTEIESMLYQLNLPNIQRERLLQTLRSKWNDKYPGTMEE